MPVLPFDKVGQVEKQGGEADGDPIELAIWPVGDRETSVGQAYDWEGEAEVAAVPLLIRKSNRQIRVADALYKVVSAIEAEFVPHVQLRLLEMRGGG